MYNYCFMLVNYKKLIDWWIYINNKELLIIINYLVFIFLIKNDISEYMLLYNF